MPTGRTLRHHAGCRHPLAAGCGAASGRQDGPSVESAEVRRGERSESSRATRCCSRASRRLCRWAAKARCFSACSRARAESIPTRPRPRTCTRICSAWAPMPARASMTSTPSRRRSPVACPRERCSATTSSRAHLPGLGWCPISKWWRNFRRATTWPPRASTAGLAGIGNCCPGYWAGAMRRATNRGSGTLPLIGLWKMLDNLRRTLSAPAGVAALLAGWLLPSTLRSAVERLHLRDHRIAGVPAGVRRDLAEPRRHHASQPSACAAQGCLARRHADRFHRHVSGAPGNLDDGCDRPDAVSLVRKPSQSAPMGDCRAGETAVPPHASRALIAAWRARSVDRRLAAPLLVGLVSDRENGWLCGAVPDPVDRCLPPSRCGSAISPARGGPSRLIGGATQRALRLVARRTWRYFETFVTAEDQMLPPDNFQEDPRPVVAHRTSPTNMGLYLLSAVSARDFGWLGTVDFVERLEATFATLSRLERFRGHFYNWYDTRDMRALDPRYVSTVDSGNLAGHLIALANACREWIDSPPSGSVISPASATPWISRARHVGALPDDRRMHATSPDQIDAALACARRGARRSPKPNTADLATRLAGLVPLAETLVDIVRTLAGEWGDEAGAELLFWSEAAQRSHAELAPGCRCRRRLVANHLKRRLAAIEETARGYGRARCSSASCSIRSAGSSRSAARRTGRLDSNCYDLLASEARLASFIAIAKNDIPARHWFRLGRSVTPIGKGAALISWSGSMFEYLMPSLVMRAPAGSLLEQTSRLIVKRQIRLWRQARYSLGNFRVRLQCARPRAHLPIFELRCPGARAQARAERKHGHRALRDGARRHGRPEKRHAKFRATRRHRRARPLWLSRGPRLHALAGPRRIDGRHRSGLHGASPGHDHRGHRQCAVRRQDAGAISRRAEHSSDRIALAGARATRCLGGSPASAGGQGVRTARRGETSRRPSFARRRTTRCRKLICSSTVDTR